MTPSLAAAARTFESEGCEDAMPEKETFSAPTSREVPSRVLPGNFEEIERRVRDVMRAAFGFWGDPYGGDPRGKTAEALIASLEALNPARRSRGSPGKPDEKLVLRHQRWHYENRLRDLKRLLREFPPGTDAAESPIAEKVEQLELFGHMPSERMMETARRRGLLADTLREPARRRSDEVRLAESLGRLRAGQLPLDQIIACFRIARRGALRMPPHLAVALWVSRDEQINLDAPADEWTRRRSGAMRFWNRLKRVEPLGFLPRRRTSAAQ